MRESPSVELMEIIQEKGATIAYSDPHVPVFPKMREHHFNLSSEEISIDNLSKFDAIILATNHDKFDYPLIKKHSKLLIDTRGIYREPAENIIKA